MDISEQIVEAVAVFKKGLAAHPECRNDLRDASVLAGTLHPYPVFYLGRMPDPEHDDNPSAPPPSQIPPERLLAYLQTALKPLDMLNPVSPIRNLGKGTGTLAASFGIKLNPELGFTPEGSRDINELLGEGIPDVESSGILPEMREDIEVTKALTPNWLKIALPDMQGPFNLAHMILGNEAFMAPFTQASEWKKFMGILVEFFVKVHQKLTDWIGPERLYTHPCLYHRLAECSVNMVAKDFYLEHILEYDRFIVAYYGEAAIHPCSGPHVFSATLEKLSNVVYTEAGNMESKMTAGSIQVDDALAAIAGRPVMLSIGEELPAGKEEETLCRLFELALANPRVSLGGFTGVAWKKEDDPVIRDLHLRMNDYYTSRFNNR